MVLDLDDERVRVRLTRMPGDRARLVIDYPCEPQYRDAVFAALADLLRPKPRRRRARPADAEGE